MTQCADNFLFDITAWEGHHEFDMLELCLKIAFADHKYAERWIVDDGEMAAVELGRRFPMWKTPPRLVFLWGGDEGLPLLTRATSASLKPMILDWLLAIDYANQPDHDGDNSKGWRIYNHDSDRSWDRIGNHEYSICAIEPAWLMHGK